MPNQFDPLLTSSTPQLCAIAAPGSGKTSHLLLPKAIDILNDPNITPRDVLLLTFSRLSAQDLKHKVAQLERAPRATTVHSYALAFLISEDNHDIRARVDSILLDFETDVLVSDLKLQFAKTGKRTLRKDLKEFSAAWARLPHDRVFEEDDYRRRFKAAIVNWLYEHKSAMMDEILYFAVDLAKKVPDAPVIHDPQHILVDEYQDLNLLEQEFIDALAARSRLLLVVGDPDQSIYSFKYAHPAGITSFAERPTVHAHYGLTTWRCPRRVVEFANQLLQQADPARTALVESREDAIEGEVAFVRRATPPEEFDCVLQSIASRLAANAPASEIIVLVPRVKLGVDFVSYANKERESMGLPTGNEFCMNGKPAFTQLEKERILLLGLLARPDSLLHARAYIGLSDANHFASEIQALKNKHGGLAALLSTAHIDSLPKNALRMRQAVDRLLYLRAFLDEQQHNRSASDAIDKLFSADTADLSAARAVLLGLLDAEDTVEELYGKFVDYLRTAPHKDSQIRVMTLMGSKGLEADHVYMIGCNAGNIPGENRSLHLDDAEHRKEQIRLLYVGFTRAKQSLMVSWSQFLPFGTSKTQNTKGVKTVTYKGKPMIRMNICEFLQDLNGASWQ